MPVLVHVSVLKICYVRVKLKHANIFNCGKNLTQMLMFCVKPAHWTKTLKYSIGQKSRTGAMHKLLICAPQYCLSQYIWQQTSLSKLPTDFYCLHVLVAIYASYFCSKASEGQTKVKDWLLNLTWFCWILDSSMDALRAITCSFTFFLSHQNQWSTIPKEPLSIEPIKCHMTANVITLARAWWAHWLWFCI